MCWAQRIRRAWLRAVGLGDGFDGGQVGGARAGGCGRRRCGAVAEGAAVGGRPWGGEGAQERHGGLYPGHARNGNR